MRQTSFGSLRGWHLWISVALAMPIFIVSLTAIFIAHGKTLGLRSIEVPLWLAPASDQGRNPKDAEWRSHLAAAEGAQWLGGKGGVFRLDAQGHVTEIDGPDEVRDMAWTSTGGVLIAAKNGLWLAPPQGMSATELRTGDFWTVDVRENAWVAMGKDAMPQWSLDEGRSWQDMPEGVKMAEKVQAHLAARPAGPARPLTADKLIMDWHTGKAILGKKHEWVWIDVVGASMALLTVTGLLMWWRGQRRKAQALAAQAASAPHAQPSASPTAMA